MTAKHVLAFMLIRLTNTNWKINNRMFKEYPEAGTRIGAQGVLFLGLDTASVWVVRCSWTRSMHCRLPLGSSRDDLDVHLGNTTTSTWKESYVWEGRPPGTSRTAWRRWSPENGRSQQAVTYGECYGSSRCKTVREKWEVYWAWMTGRVLELCCEEGWSASYIDEWASEGGRT